MYKYTFRRSKLLKTFIDAFYSKDEFETSTGITQISLNSDRILTENEVETIIAKLKVGIND